MNKKRSERIRTLVSLAENQEHQAARDLGQTRQLLEEHERKLTELCEYREEYLQRFKQDGQQGISGNQLQAFQAFMQQLDMAIANQDQLVTQIQQQCQQHTRHWQQRHQKTRMLDKTCQRYVDQERRQADKQQQREADDRAGMQHLKITD